MGIPINKAFPLPLLGFYIEGGRWELAKPFEYRNPPIAIKVPMGFISDGASIPRIFWSLIGSPWSGKYAKAAIIHDFLYTVKTTTRLKADRIFLTGMVILGVSWWRRLIMYAALRIGGGFAWKKK